MEENFGYSFVLLAVLVVQMVALPHRSGLLQESGDL